jgi:hypothetical protein
MSFLGDLFDPVGAIASGGNNSTFDSIFNPGQDAFGSSGLIPDFANSTDMSNSVGNFADSVGDTNLDELKNLGNHFTRSPQQLLTGVDPLSTKLWNGVTDQKNNPWVGQYGGETNQDYQNSNNRGINTSGGQIAGSIANMIAGYEGGAALGGLAGSSMAGSGLGGTTEGSAGSSAFSDMTGATSGGGFGSSQTAIDASQIPGYASTGAGAYTGLDRGVGNMASGASQGGANSLNNGTNPFKGAFLGGARGGLGSNLDYAGTMGVTDPLYKAGINGAITGAGRTAMNGGDATDSGYGALVGALGGAVQQAGPTLSNWAGQAGNAVGNFFGGSSNGSGGGVNPSTGTTNWGNLAAGLGNMYMSSRNNAGIQSQINNLSGMYGPNSAYAQQMQQQLQRQDAASGRGSQYGTRAVELQAALANANSRNAPTLANLYAQQRQNRFGQLAGMFGMARNAGMFGSQQPQGSAGFTVGGMGNPGDGGMGSFTPQMQTPNYSPVEAGQGDYSQMDPNQVRQNVMGTIPGGY